MKLINLGNATETNNPLSYAEKLLQTDNIEIHYVSISNNANASQYAPCSYTIYQIIHRSDTLTVNTINYITGIIYTNVITRGGAWRGWKKATMTAA